MKKVVLSEPPVTKYCDRNEDGNIAINDVISLLPLPAQQSWRCRRPTTTSDGTANVADAIALLIDIT